jgi:hypothetical protein
LIFLRGLTFIFCAFDLATMAAPKEPKDGVSGTRRTGFGLVAGVFNNAGEAGLESRLPALAPEFLP